MGKIKKIHKDFLNKKYSVTEFIQYTLKRIKRTNKILGTYITITEKEALKVAKSVDYRISKGEKINLLSGIPMGIKDNISTKNIVTTCASKILENYIPIYNATVVEKLNKLESVLIGKCNMDEFAMGSTNENSSFYPVKNPWNLNNIPGGSSGGSAATVAAEEVVFSLGTDTGGSIRQPASCCGVVGLKPTYGLVSRFGLVSYASSLDQIGPLTKTIEDCAIVFEAITGYDPLDSTSIKTKNLFSANFPLKFSMKNLKIGILKEYFKGDKNIINKIKEALKIYESLGAYIEEVSIPHAEYALPAYYAIASAEASSNLARFDSIRYGKRVEHFKNLKEMVTESRSKYLGKEVKKRIMIGAYVLSEGYYDAYYLKALKIKNLLKKDFDKAFDRYDILISPVMPTLPYLKGEGLNDPMLLYLGDLCTASVNLVGIPGLAVPCGFINNLPVGMQLIGKNFSENLLLRIGLEYEKITKFYKKTPKIEAKI